MRVLCVIPARIGSTRLPEKPLQVIAGQPLIRHVVTRVLGFDFVDHVIVATDDGRVAEAVSHLPVEVVMTSREARCGTERVAEVAMIRPAEYVINIQGDEPFVSDKAVAGALELVEGGEALATAASGLVEDDLHNPNVTKVWMGPDGAALGFTRDLAGGPVDQGGGGVRVGRHIGVYAYRRDALLRWANMMPIAQETEQGLEQLRPMFYGERIAVALVGERTPPGIDTYEDLHVAERYMSALTEYERI
jgi:3-deoxy-manno-octulosonate cytidylyltransferase (CMP-KDO synthetase)